MASVGAVGDAPCPPVTECSACAVDLEGKTHFSMRANGGRAAKCRSCALRHWPTIRRSLVIALGVGTFITGLNQGEALWMAQALPRDLAWKIPITYLVPFAVATYGALSNAKTSG